MGATNAEGLIFLFTKKHLCACKGYKSKKKIDWLHRQGTVLSVSSVTDSVYIRWDGRVSSDVWPFRAVEKTK